MMSISRSKIHAAGGTRGWRLLVGSIFDLYMHGDELTDHVGRLDAHGVLPLYTRSPAVGATWPSRSNASSCAGLSLAGQHPQTPAEIITWWEETVASGRSTPPPSSGAACAKHGGSAPGCGAWVPQARRCPMAPQFPCDPLGLPRSFPFEDATRPPGEEGGGADEVGAALEGQDTARLGHPRVRQLRRNGG